jgi:hypothetical protein
MRLKVRPRRAAVVALAGTMVTAELSRPALATSTT